MFVRSCSAALAFALCASAFSSVAAVAQSASSMTTARSTTQDVPLLAGAVVDQSGLAVAGATIRAIGRGIEKSTTTSATGGYAFSNLQPGLYQVVVSGGGYQPQRANDVAVVKGSIENVSFVLTRARTQQDLSTIATVSTHAGNPIASTTTITRSLEPQILTSEGYLRFGDQLRTLPGVNLGGLTSSVGDDLYINIRGMGTSETQALLDGHPVGPIGVYAFNGGGNFPTSFNFADSPGFALNKVEVTFGSGSSGLYGNDAIGGTINMETLNPTAERHYEMQYGIGDQGKQISFAKATGMLGKLGYAFAGGVTGTYGMFSPQQITQTALPDNAGNPCPAVATQFDLTPCHYAANTYTVSQNTNVRSGLAKLSYALSPNTTLSGSWFASGQWADSTGNGDNDNIPYDYRLYQLSQNGKPDCALPGDKSGTMSGYSVTTGSGAACDTPQQLASATSGPFGGGAGRARGTSMFDYHTRLRTVSGRSTYTVDYFFNHYKFFKTSEDSAGLNPDGTCCGGTVYSQFLNSQGVFVSDEITNENSDFGFGYFAEHQIQTRLNYQFAGQGLYNYSTPASPGYASIFAKGSVNFSPTASVYANAWVKRSTTDQTTSFDPRVSLVLRPKSGADVFRFTYGHSTGDPAAELIQSGAVVTANPASAVTGFRCNAFNQIGNGGNPSIKPEVGSDLEFGYAHRFQNDSNVQLNLYQTNVTNQLFSAALPISQYAGSVPLSPTLLAGFAQDAITNGCPGVTLANPNSVLQYLAIGTTYNATRARYRGIEISGRQRFSRNFFVDYSYDIQSAQQTGVSDNILQNNPFIINDHQIQGIPYNQATLAFDYSIPHGWQAHADGYFVSNNNVSRRPAYNFWSGYVGKSIGKGMTVRLGMFNVFNQATQNYGYIGHQQFIPENHFFNDTNSLQQALNAGGEEFGLANRSFVLTFSQRM